ncbi:MAG: SDR family NAD(P)-dependent oxidoreductase, partial [Saprospiraceae bacterium]|nr:SDR family NAD(P)-dependent oxidoreductase [Saprospiraceae bacterium]
MKELAGKTVLVTGASRGIGKAIAIALGKCGCNVAINYLIKDDAAEDTRKQIEDAGSKAHSFKADVSKKSEVDRLVDEVTSILGSIDILV